MNSADNLYTYYPLGWAPATTSITSTTTLSKMAYFYWWQQQRLRYAQRPKAAPNPYAVDPDQRHLARIRSELEAPWTPNKRRPR